MTAFKIGSVKGIPIRIHVTFLLILPFLAFVFGNVLGIAARAAGVPPEALGGPAWLWGLGLALALFASVLLHELAHALYAIRKGGEVKDIILLMIGGVSRLEKAPERPRDEALMALAGPLTSLGIGALCLGAWAALAGMESWGLRFTVFYLGQLNIFLGLFNLLPAFPMDGGRITRSLLTKRMGRVRATQLAGNLGKGFAVLFGLLGLFSFNFILILIAFFVYLGAEGERRQVVVEAALGGVRVRDLMSRAIEPVSPHATADELALRMKAERRTVLALGDGLGGVEGIVTLEALRKVGPDQRHTARARDLAMKVEALSPDEEAWPALRKLYSQKVSQLPVVEHGRLVGMLRQTDVTQALELRELDQNGRTSAPWGQREREA